MSECKAVRADGTTCRAHALRGGDFCFFHDPDKRGALIQATRKGGARRTIELPEGEPLSPDRIRGIIAYFLEAIAAGAVDAHTARALGYVLRVDNRVQETHCLEQRLCELEEMVKGMKPSHT